MHQFSDIHTHRPGISGSVLSVEAAEVERVLAWNHAKTTASEMVRTATCQHYSLQLHPWHLKGNDDIVAFLACAHRLEHDPCFVAIGECGLDPLCPTPLSLQHAAFLSALRLARELRKPVIVHCVRLWAEMMHDVASVLSPEECRALPVIIHGYRKGPQLARQLLNAGFSISLGRHYNAEVRQLIPPEALYFESDEQPDANDNLSQTFDCNITE